MNGRKVDTTVTLLEMTADPKHHAGPPPLKPFALLHVERPPVHFYRYLYDTVGRDWLWVDRKVLDDETLAGLIHKEGIEIFVPYAAGVPAGFFELDTSEPDRVDLAYFGIMPDFIGTGLGKWLLKTAIEMAWAKEPERLTVETCTLDHPRALPLYQRLGFSPYAQQEKVMTIPEDLGLGRAE